MYAGAMFREVSTRPTAQARAVTSRVSAMQYVRQPGASAGDGNLEVGVELHGVAATRLPRWKPGWIAARLRGSQKRLSDHVVARRRRGNLPVFDERPRCRFGTGALPLCKKWGQ